MSDTSTGGTPAGWYEDGVTAGQERYWDGTQWTDQFRPIAPPAAPPAPAAPIAPEAPASAYPAYPAYPAAAATAPGTAYPAYQPAQAASGIPGAPRKGLSKGAIIGIIAAVAAVIVAVILILGFTVWGWAGGGGGGASNAQQQQFLSSVKQSGGVTASDAALLEVGNKFCDAGRTIVAGDYLGGMTKYFDTLNADLDFMTLGTVAAHAMTDLCPEVQAQLEELGESFSF